VERKPSLICRTPGQRKTADTRNNATFRKLTSQASRESNEATIFNDKSTQLFVPAKREGKATMLSTIGLWLCLQSQCMDGLMLLVPVLRVVDLA